MSGKVFDADSPAGVPTVRNGGPVIGAFPINIAGSFVVLVHQRGHRYVTATTRTGDQGWNAGRYHTYSYLDDDTEEGTEQAFKCRSRATADFLVRCAGMLPVAGVAYFVNELAVREPALMDLVTGVTGAAWMTGEDGQRLAADADTAERQADPRHILSTEPTDAEREYEENARFSELGTDGWPMG